MKIQPLTRATIEPCIHLGELYWQDSPYRAWPYSRTRCYQLGRTLIDHPDYAGWVAQDQGKTVGMMLGTRSRWPFGPVWIGTDLLLYVLPEYRTGTAAARLVRAFESWCWLAGCSVIRPSITVQRDSAVARWWCRRGYRVIGTMLERTRGE